MKLKNKQLLFWLGWSIWICMVVVKVFMVFGDCPDFCWDPMFLMVPLVFILIGGHTCECCHCKKAHCEKCGCHTECDCDCHKIKE